MVVNKERSERGRGETDEGGSRVLVFGQYVAKRVELEKTISLRDKVRGLRK